MDLIDNFREISQSIPQKLEYITNEESTKTALILPFIEALGYDFKNPAEVVPEFTADIGHKKGEKVDYAIMIDNKPVILIECKYCNSNLHDLHASQLYRYFTSTPARLGILTNGIVYRFFTDMEKDNVMDKKPFLEIDMLNLKEPLIKELKRFTKSSFDLDNILTAASELKYKREIKMFISDQINDPDDDFIKFFTKAVYNDPFTQNVKMQFKPLIKSSFNEFIKEKVDNRLKTALDVPDTGDTVIDTPEIPIEPPKTPNKNRTNYRGTRLSYFSFEGNEFKAAPWISMLIEICNIMAKTHKDDFNKVLNLKGRVRNYFSLYRDDLKSPKKIDGTEIFVETNLNSNNIVSISKKVINLFGHDENNLIIGTTE